MTAVHIPAPNRFCAHNPRVSPHQLVEHARALFRPTAATPNRNEQLNRNKNCVTMAAATHRNNTPRVSQLLGCFSEIEDLNWV